LRIRKKKEIKSPLPGFKKRVKNQAQGKGFFLGFSAINSGVPPDQRWKKTKAAGCLSGRTSLFLPPEGARSITPSRN